MKRVLTSLVLVLLCTISVLAQDNITVTGTVVDVKNVPLAGVASEELLDEYPRILMEDSAGNN